MSDLDIAKLKAICIGYLQGRGFELVQRTDFAQLESELPELDKQFVTPNLSMGFHDLSEADTFWLTMNLEGELKAVMGMHLQSIGRQRFSEFLKATYARLYPTADADAVYGQNEEVDTLVKGRLCYMGDLFFEKSIRGDVVQLMCFVHLAHALCFDKWQHDWTYAFHRRKDVLDGYADRYGFGPRWMGYQRWSDPPDYRSNSEYLSVLSRSQFERHAVHYAKHPEDLLSVDQRNAQTVKTND